jgi:hypothetical protein
VTEPTPTFTASAGRVLFPNSAAVLNDTTICPACFTPLASSVCGECDLDLTHPASTELAAISSSAAACLDRRVELIGQIRFETAAASARRAAYVVTPAHPLTSPAESPAESVPAIPATPPSSHTPGTPPAPARSGRSSVQILLLVTGVALLSAYGIYAVATGQLGVIALSLVVAALTAATYVLASFLHRRGLRSTAEGIAVLAVVLTYLCALAARANNLFEFAEPTTSVFWGWTLLITSVLFVVWSRFSHLRAPGLVGFSAVGIGAGVLVNGLATGLEDLTRAYVAFLTVVVVGLVQAIAERSLLRPQLQASRVPERILVIVPAAVSSLCVFVLAFLVAPDNRFAAAVALVVLGCVALLHIGVALRASDVSSPSHRAVSIGIAITAGAGAAISFGITGFALASRLGSSAAAEFWPAVLAAVVLLGADVLRRRARRTPPKSAVRSTTLSALWSAAVTALFCVALPAGTAMVLVLIPVTAGLEALSVALPGAVSTFGVQSYSLGTVSTANTQDYPYAAVGTFAVITALAALVWTLTGVVAARRVALGWMLGATAIVAVPLLERTWLLSAGWFAIAAASVALFIILTKKSPSPPTLSVRILALSTVLVATLLAYIVSWATPSTWWWGSLVAIALLLLARRIVAPNHGPVRAGLLGAATVVALLAVGSIGRQIGADPSISPLQSLDWLRFTAILATAVVIVSGAVRAGWFAASDRRTLFWVATPVAALTALAPVIGLPSRTTLPVLAEPVTGLLLALALVAALLVWIGVRATAPFRIERLAASVALAPAVSWSVFQFSRLLQLPTSADVLTPITAALLVSAGALALSTRRTSSIPRWAREAGIALVALPTVLVAIASPGEFTWLVLLLGGISALLLAVSADGLLASVSPRRHLGWVALLLATAGLWWRLADSDVAALEPYVLPLSGVLLVLAFLLARSANRRTASEPGVAPYIALAALLVAILPLGATAATGSLVRPITVGLISAALLLVGTLTTGSRVLRPYLDVAAAAGVAGVLTVSIGRAAVLTDQSSGTSGPALDAWLGAAFIVLVIAAFGLTRTRTDLPARVRVGAAQIVGAAALTLLLVVEVANFASTGLGVVRALAVLLLFCAVHVIAVAANTAPLTSRVGWLALVYAVVAAVAGLVVADIDPLEIATVPVALALLATGIIHLDRTPAARSWPTLGPGTLVLLLPSLFVTLDDRPLWRLVALGVVAVVVMIVGAVRRLQAPFLIGAAVTLIHVLGTFSSEIRAVYESAHWLLWAGIGGAILIVLAARYEQRVQNLKSIVLRVTALR